MLLKQGRKKTNKKLERLRLGDTERDNEGPRTEKKKLGEVF